MAGKLGVIVPVYNKRQYLDKCIDSILRQKYAELDIILVDDGSMDGSGELCEKYASEYENIKVIHQKNQGPNKARIAGVHCAESPYITFVDADDWIDENMYCVLMEQIQDCDLIACGIIRYFTRENMFADQLKYAEGVYERTEIVEQIIPDMLWHADTNGWRLDPSLCSKIFRRESIMNELKRAENLNCHFGDDTAVLFPLMLRIEKIKILSQCFYFHRQRKSDNIPEYIDDDNYFDKTYNVYQYLKKQFKQSDYWDIMKGQLDHFYFNAVQLKKMCYRQKTGDLYPIFPFKEIPLESKVIIYGAGKVGKEYISQNERYRFCNVIMWVDKNYKSIHVEGYKIKSPSQIADVDFDYIIIAIDSMDSAAMARKYLVESGVPIEKIIWQNIRMRDFH